MSSAIDDDEDALELTLEQGRRHLDHIAKQLHSQKQCDSSASSSNRQHLQAERKLLDQKPRGDRLKNRKGSPLGLTLEELDDRGLLEGGGVVPSYYTSLRQKQRRSLELQRRSSRMKNRGHEDVSKSYKHDALFRMIRFLNHRNANIDGACQLADINGRGIIEKSHLFSIIRNFGLPFTEKDLRSFTKKYSVSDEHIDYEAFFHDVLGVREPFLDGETNTSTQEQTLCPSSCGDIMRKFYHMLHDSKNRLRKSVDDIYRMFSCWDKNGKGSVTSTQFFRVLSQLHVTFSDQEQDFIVDLLDTFREGKINFEMLLEFCFDNSSDDEAAAISGDSRAQGDDSLVSLDGGSIVGGTIVAADGRSISSGTVTRRPHTAAAVRSAFSFGEGDNDMESHGVLNGIASPCGVSSQSSRGISPHIRGTRRPLTACARVNPSIDKRQGAEIDTQKWNFLEEKISEDDRNYILDDISSGSETEEVKNVDRARKYSGRALRDFLGSEARSNSDRKCFTCNRSPKMCICEVRSASRNMPNRPCVESLNDDDVVSEAYIALRQYVVVRNKKHGLSIQDIFNIFDRRSIHYLDANDLQAACQECNISINFDIAKSLVKKIALDGIDRISYGEFFIWATDPSHLDLQEQVQMQLADRLEQQGREYQYLIYSILMHGEDAQSHSSSPLSGAGLVPKKSFATQLRKIGLSLHDTDFDRIAHRFDTHGTDQCSVSRFMRMAQNNLHWKNAIEALTYQEEALEEAQIVRQRMQSNCRHAIPIHFEDETLDMAEYLGIRVLSEPHLLWIVQKALKIPLPKAWAMHQDKEGRTFFYNAVTQETRWDHPADPQLRKLRDHYRKRADHAFDEVAKQGVSQTVTTPEAGASLDYKISPNKREELKNYIFRDKSLKMNNILLYDKSQSASNIKGGAAPDKKSMTSYLPSGSARNRASSAGRVRNKITSRRNQQRCLEHMFGDSVIEELDLAMQSRHPSGNKNQKSGKNKLTTSVGKARAVGGQAPAGKDSVWL